jgi:putative salt-induced outer membrane protein YdiY
MNLMHFMIAGSLLATIGLAQDRVTLANGDVLTGKIKTMAGGKLTIASPLLGDVTVDIAQVQNLTTDAAVELATVTGEKLQRRIVGIEEASLEFDGDVPAIAIDNLAMINPPQAEPPKWTGTLSLSAFWIDGNTRRRTVGAFGEASRKTETDRITVDAFWDYAEDKAVGTGWNLTQRRVGAGLKYDYFIDKRWYALGTTRVLGDTFADLDLRFTAGVGIGYTVIDDGETTLVTEAGLSYFDENYRSNTPSKDYIAARVAYRLTHQLSAQTKLIHGIEAYPSVEDKNDIYLQMKTELSTNLSGNMVASLSHIMDYDNTPSPGLRRDDHRVFLSIGWTF